MFIPIVIISIIKYQNYNSTLVLKKQKINKYKELYRLLTLSEH